MSSLQAYCRCNQLLGALNISPVSLREAMLVAASGPTPFYFGGRNPEVDEMPMTSVPDVFAAGDITPIAHNVTFARANGVIAAMAIHRSLAIVVAPSRPT